MLSIIFSIIFIALCHVYGEVRPNTSEPRKHVIPARTILESVSGNLIGIQRNGTNQNAATTLASKQLLFKLITDGIVNIKTTEVSNVDNIETMSSFTETTADNKFTAKGITEMPSLSLQLKIEKSTMVTPSALHRGISSTNAEKFTDKMRNDVQTTMDIANTINSNRELLTKGKIFSSISTVSELIEDTIKETSKTKKHEANLDRSSTRLLSPSFSTTMIVTMDSDVRTPATKDMSTISMATPKSPSVMKTTKDTPQLDPLTTAESAKSTTIATEGMEKLLAAQTTTSTRRNETTNTTTLATTTIDGIDNISRATTTISENIAIVPDSTLEDASKTRAVTQIIDTTLATTQEQVTVPTPSSSMTEGTDVPEYDDYLYGDMRNMYPEYAVPLEVVRDPCQGNIDAITVAGNGQTYAFLSDNIYSFSSMGVKAGYPKLIHQVFPHGPATVDAALSVAIGMMGLQQRTYLIKGTSVWRFSSSMFGTFSLDSGYPVRVVAEFGLRVDRVDAAFALDEQNIINIVSGGLYWNLMIDEHGNFTADMQPRSFASRTPGLGMTSLSAAMRFTNGDTYFFDDQNYWKTRGLHPLSRLIGPRSTGKWWYGCP